MGLSGWQIFYVKKKLEGSYAECTADIENRNASIILNSEFANEMVTKDIIRISAFHEVCELWFARIEAMTRARFITERDIREEIHNLIRILENTIYKEKRG